jgi:hypothetical protein
VKTAGDIREILGMPREGFDQRENYPPYYDDDGNIIGYDTRTELGKKLGPKFNYEPPIKNRTPKERKEYIANWLADNMDLPEIAIKGLLGNIHQETGGTFSHTQLQDEGRSGTGYGLIQFSSPGQKEAYFKFVENNNLQDSIDAQLLYIKNEFDTGDQIGGKNARRLRNTIFDPNLTIEQSARAWSDILIQPGTPHMDRRIEYSKSAGGFIDMQEGGLTPDSEGIITLPDTGVIQNEVETPVDTTQGFYSVNPAPGESGEAFAARNPLPTLEERFPVGETKPFVPDPLEFKPPKGYVSPRVSSSLMDRLSVVPGSGDMSDADTALAESLAGGIGTGPSEYDPAYTDRALVAGITTIDSYLTGSDAADMVKDAMDWRWVGANYMGGESSVPVNWDLEGWTELQSTLIDFKKNNLSLGDITIVDKDGEFQFLGSDESKGQTRMIPLFGDEKNWIRQTDLVYDKNYMTPEEAMPFNEYIENILEIRANTKFTYKVRAGGETLNQISDRTGISVDILAGRIRRDNNSVYRNLINEQSAGAALPIFGTETVSDLTYGRYQAIGSSGTPPPPDLNKYKISSPSDITNYALDTTTGKFISKTDYDNSKAYMYDSYEDRWLTQPEFNNVEIEEYTVGGAAVNPLAEITGDTVIQEGIELTLPERLERGKIKQTIDSIGDWFTKVKNTELGSLPGETRVTIGSIADDMFAGLTAGFLTKDGKFDYEKAAIAGAGSFAKTNVVDAYANKAVIEIMGNTGVADLATKLNIDITDLGAADALNKVMQSQEYANMSATDKAALGTQHADAAKSATHMKALGGAAASAITTLALGGDLEDAAKSAALTAGGVYGAEYMVRPTAEGGLGMPAGAAGAIIGATLALLQGGGVKEAGKGAAYGYLLSTPAAPFAYALMAIEFLLAMKKPSNKTGYASFDLDDFDIKSFGIGDYDPSKRNDDNYEFTKKIAEPLVQIAKGIESEHGINLLGDIQIHYGGRDGLYYTIGSRDVSGTPREMFLNRLDYFDGRDQSTADGGTVYRSRRFGADQAGIADLYKELLGEFQYIVDNNITDLANYTGKRLSLEETKTLLAKANITGTPSGIRQGGKISLDKGGNVQYNKGNYGLVNKKGKAPPSARADDVPMSLKEGDYVLSQPAVALYGEDTINRMLSRAATKAGKNLKAGGKVPVNVHNGEYIIPKNLTKYIGSNVLETMNNRGLMSVGERPNT